MANIDEQIAQFIITDSYKYAEMPVHPANKLYFLTDTEEIYRGNVLFTASVVFFTGELPIEGALRKIYINSETFNGYCWDGEKWNTIINNYNIVSEITDTTDNTSIPNVEAIKRLNASNITDLEYNNTAKTLVFTKNNKQNSIKLTGLITSGEVDYDTNKVILRNIDGEEVLSFKIKKDNYLLDGYYDPSTKNIVFKMSSSETGEPYDLIIPAEGLVKVTISKVEGNILKEYDDGYGAVIDLSSKIDKVPKGNDGRILTAKTDGNANALDMYVGGTHLSLTESEDGRKHASSNILATESAVYEYISNLEETVNKNSDYAIVKTIDKENPSPKNITSESAVVTLWKDIVTLTNNINSTIEGLQQSVSNNETSNTELSNRLQSIQQTADEMSEIANELRPMVETIEGVTDTLDKNQQDISTNSEAITKLQSSLSTLQNKVNSINDVLEAHITSSSNNIDNINSSITKLNTNLSNMRTELDLRVDDFTSSITDLTSRIEALELSLDKPTTGLAQTYTGNILNASDSINGYDSNKMNITGKITATNAGTYSVSITPKNNYTWEDGTTDSITLSWIINKASINKPTLSGTYTYNTTEQSVTINNYDSNKMTISGDITATNAGTYSVSIVPKSNYKWSDDTTVTITLSWIIDRASVNKPTAGISQTYNGNVLNAVDSIDGYDSNKMSISDDTTAINAGTYSVSITPKDNYKWSDDTINYISLEWNIDRAVVDNPTLKSAQIYTGNELNAIDSIDGYDSNKMSISGDTTGTNAGTYSVSVTPKSNYKWSDDTTVTITLSWTIDKADENVSVDKTSVSLNTSTITDTITVSRLGTGVITAISSDDTIVSTSVSDNVITITGLSGGNATITINIDEDNNYNRPNNIVISVECSLPRIITDMTPEEIKNISDSGQAANYFSVGDMIPITLSGTVAETSISGTYKAVILGINHNTDKEDSTGIDFIIGKDIAFCDSNYSNSYDNGGRMVMNTNSTNSGGWGSSYMNSTICTEFLNILPTEWQSVIKDAKKYTDNTGNKTNTEDCITLSQSKIWLLSEYEVFGIKKYSNEYEKNYQLQYDYYKNGNSKIRYNHNDTSIEVNWWLRSPVYNSNNAFCIVNASGSASCYYANNSYGFTTCFRI